GRPQTFSLRRRSILCLARMRFVMVTALQELLLGVEPGAPPPLPVPPGGGRADRPTPIPGRAAGAQRERGPNRPARSVSFSRERGQRQWAPLTTARALLLLGRRRRGARAGGGGARLGGGERRTGLHVGRNQVPH